LGTPGFITGLQTALTQLANWMLILVPAVIVITFVIGGIALAKAEDGTETKAVKDRMARAIIGAAIAGTATWVGQWVVQLFNLNPGG
jgi:predicted small integral membrane protein